MVQMVSIVMEEQGLSILLVINPYYDWQWSGDTRGHAISSYDSDLVTGIILNMCSANDSRRCIVTSSLIGWAHTQNDPCSNIRILRIHK